VWEDEAQEVIDDGLDGDREQIMAVARSAQPGQSLIDEVGESLQTSAEISDLPESRRGAGRANRGCLAQWHGHDPDQQAPGTFRRAVPGAAEIQGLRRRGRGRGRDGDGDGDGTDDEIWRYHPWSARDQGRCSGYVERSLAQVPTLGRTHREAALRMGVSHALGRILR